VLRLALRDEDAVQTLARVAAGELSRCVLPWVVLMHDGGESTVIEEWKRLADREPDQHLRLQYAADALVFAEPPDVTKEWKQALEGWNVRESQQVLEWQAEAVVKTRQADLLRFLERRCKASVPNDLADTIQSTQDVNLLLRWVDAAADVNSFDDFRAAMRSQG
jgi:hypothetical protein